MDDETQKRLRAKLALLPSPLWAVKDTCPELLEYDALVEEAWYVQPSTGESLASSNESDNGTDPSNSNWVCR